MIRCLIIPDGWECTLEECPPGLFVYNKGVHLKTEYGGCEAYCDSGETFWGGTDTKEKKAKLMVQPVRVHWEYFED